MILSISYDLNAPGKNYQELYKTIKDCGDWWHYLDSTWFVDTNLTPEQVSTRLRSKMDNNDYLIVIRVTDNPMYAGWLKKEAWDWLDARAY